MCWASTNVTTRKVAEKDFYVYKIGKIVGNTIFVSDVRGFLYAPKRPNRVVSLTVQIISRTKYIIQKGYHSYKWIALDNTCPGNKSLYLGNYIPSLKVSLEEYRYCCVGTFIIPKGAEYFENEYGHIVSSDIIYTGRYLKL